MKATNSKKRKLLQEHIISNNLKYCSKANQTPLIIKHRTKSNFIRDNESAILETMIFKDNLYNRNQKEIIKIYTYIKPEILLLHIS